MEFACSASIAQAHPSDDMTDNVLRRIGFGCLFSPVLLKLRLRRVKMGSFPVICIIQRRPLLEPEADRHYRLPVINWGAARKTSELSVKLGRDGNKKKCLVTCNGVCINQDRTHSWWAARGKSLSLREISLIGTMDMAWSSGIVYIVSTRNTTRRV